MMAFMWRLSFFVQLVLVCLCVTQVRGQAFELRVDPDSLRAEKYFNLNHSFFDTEKLKEHLSLKKDSLVQDGFFLTSIDEFEIKDSLVHIKIHLGNRIEFIEIEPSINSVDFPFTKKQFKSWQSVEDFKKRVLRFYTDNGFLDTKVSLDSLMQNKKSFQAILNIQKGKQYRLDTLKVGSNSNISYPYLVQYFNIREDEIITSQLIDKIKERGRQSEIFQLIGEPKIQLNPWGTASIHLNLKEKKANAFDLLIGLLPNSSTSIAEKALLVTGQGKLRVMNPFGKGREFKIDYRQLQPESPMLNVATFLPSILKQNFGVRGKFDLTKQDSAFVNLNFKLGANYRLNEKSHLVFHVNSVRSYLQKVDTTRVILLKELPESVDFNKVIYSAEYMYSKIDRPVVTRKGLKMSSDFGVGVLRIQPNSSILNIRDNSFDYSTLYNGLIESLPIYEANIAAQYFYPIGKNATALYQNRSGSKWHQYYASNDLFRLGGAKSIRGFDEMSYFSNLYTINTLEYRLLLSQESFFSLFSDVAFLENKKKNQENILIGIGTGLDISTKAGIFTIDMAIGRDKMNPFDFSQSRIHFGYINVF